MNRARADTLLGEIKDALEQKAKQVRTPCRVELGSQCPWTGVVDGR